MNKLSATILCLCLVSIGLAQEAKQFSLNQAKTYALENNYAVKNAYQDIEIAKKQQLEATSMGLPQVSIQGSFTNFINLPVQVVDASFINPNAPEGETISFRAGTEYTATGTLQANQLLFNGSYIVGLQVSKFFVGFSETAAQVSQEDVLFNVTQAYQIATVGKENLKFVDSMVFYTEKLVEDQREYNKLGLLSDEDLDQMEFSLLNAKTAKTTARVQYENAIALLKLTMGYPMNEAIELTETTETLMGAPSIKEKEGIHSNLTYELASKQLVLSEYNLKNYRYSQYPTLGAFFQQTYNAYRQEFDFFADKPWYPQTLWGIQLNVPIFNGGQKYAQISQAKIEVLKNENNLKQLEQSLLAQEIQFKNNLLGANQKLELQQENIRLALKIYQNALAKKEIGNGNSMDVTQKYNQLMMAQTQYITSLIDVFGAKLNLDKLYNNILK